MEELDPQNRHVNPQENVVDMRQHRNILTPLVPLLDQWGRREATPEPFTDAYEPDDFNVCPTIKVPTRVEEALHDVDMSHLFNDREGFHQAFKDLIELMRQLRENGGTTENDMEHSGRTWGH